MELQYYQNCGSCCFLWAIDHLSSIPNSWHISVQNARETLLPLIRTITVKCSALETSFLRIVETDIYRTSWTTPREMSDYCCQAAQSRVASAIDFCTYLFIFCQGCAEYQLKEKVRFIANVSHAHRNAASAWRNHVLISIPNFYVTSNSCTCSQSVSLERSRQCVETNIAQLTMSLRRISL